MKQLYGVSWQDCDESADFTHIVLDDSLDYEDRVRACFKQAHASMGGCLESFEYYQKYGHCCIYELSSYPIKTFYGPPGSNESYSFMLVANGPDGKPLIGGTS